LKNRFTSILFLCSLFSGNAFLKAQDSREILELKNNLTKTTDEKKVDQIIREIANHYIKIKSLDSAIAYGKKAIPYNLRINDVERLISLNSSISKLYISKEDYKNATPFLMEADKYLKNSSDFESKVIVNYNLSLVNSINRKYKYSTDLLKTNIQYYIDKKKVNKQYILYSYEFLFSNLFVQQNYGESYKYLNTYIDFVKKNYPENLAEAYNNLGKFYISTNDFRKAIQTFKKVMTFHLKNKDYENIALTNRNIGASYSGLKKLDSANIYFTKAYQYAESVGNKEKMADVQNLISHMHVAKGDYEKAETAIGLATQFWPDNLYNISYYAQIKVYNMTKDSLLIKEDKGRQLELKNIISNLHKNIDGANTQNWYSDPYLLISDYTTLSNAYELLGNYKNAHEFFQKAMREKEKGFGSEKMKDLSNLQSETEISNERIRIKLEEETKRIQLQKEIELKALRFEFEKKQAIAKTEEERKRLTLEEDLKRKEIQIKFDQEQEAVVLRYNQEKNIARINQEKKDAIAKADLESSKTEKNMWAVGAGLSLLLLGFAGFSYNQKRKDNRKIAEEKQKSDDLLLNILPFEVAEELKEKGKTSAKHYDEVSVLFTDFVNFTSNSERIGVQEILNELNICFTEFDRIMEKYGLEKIKTIGDAYLAVSGLPVSNDQHAKNAVSASLEILAYIQQRKIDNPNALDIRIGIHSGPVIAGIVGVKKFAYDIWGDTVNTAARMEQNSSLGKLNVSEATYELIKDDFTFEYRGKIETKGKGAMEMYFVNSSI
jgi:class 3 adenylate cyclase